MLLLKKQFMNAGSMTLVVMLTSHVVLQEVQKSDAYRTSAKVNFCGIQFDFN
jgi:hypothetical protein